MEVPGGEGLTEDKAVGQVEHGEALIASKLLQDCQTVDVGNGPEEGLKVAYGGCLLSGKYRWMVRLGAGVRCLVVGFGCYAAQ
jgi:hypothetical protein